MKAVVRKASRVGFLSRLANMIGPGRRLLVPGLCLSFACFASSLDAQVAPGGIQERKPTIKDPRYEPPQLPEHLQNEEAAEDLILSPAGDLDLEKVQRALLRKQERQAARVRRLREREFNERLESEAGRRAIEEDILEKFGVRSFPYRERGKHRHSESAGRRFQVVFFLSLPITAAFVGGGIALGRQSRGDAGALSLEEGGMAIAGGMVFSALIGWYDYRRWVRFQRERLELEGDGPAAEPPGASRARRRADRLAAGIGDETLPARDWHGQNGRSAAGRLHWGLRLRF